MKDKLKAWAIHKLGGFTKEAVEKSDEARKCEIAYWKSRYQELIDLYGTKDTICARRIVDAALFSEAEWKAVNDALEEVFDVMRENARKYVQMHAENDYERNQKIVTVSVDILRKVSF